MAKNPYKTSSDIKVGVVGYGGAFNMGRQHLKQMADAGMTPAAVAEIDPERLEVATTDFPGIETYRSVGAMLRESAVDLVTIITPHNTHAKLARQCLKAGRHVVCEKPLALTTAECDAMIREAKASKVMLSTYHNRHWDGCILEAAKRLRAGAVGEIVRIEAHMGRWSKPGDWWRSSKSVSGGILYDWGVHLLEYSLQLLDGEVREIAGFAKAGFWAGQTKWKEDTIEDEAFAAVRFSSGQWLTLSVSHLDANPKRGLLEITGTKGTYLMDHRQWEIVAPSLNGQIKRVTGPNPESEGWRYYRNVADHLVKGAPLVITPEWSRRPIHILDLASRSAAQNRSLRARYG